MYVFCLSYLFSLGHTVQKLLQPTKQNCYLSMQIICCMKLLPSHGMHMKTFRTHVRRVFMTLFFSPESDKDCRAKTNHPIADAAKRSAYRTSGYAWLQYELLFSRGPGLGEQWRSAFSLLKSIKMIYRGMTSAWKHTTACTMDAFNTGARLPIPSWLQTRRGSREV
jgi:hypothetical protein